MLKHADAFTEFTSEFSSVASREITSRTVLRRRLLFVLFALGTNMGIKHIVDGAAEAGETEAALRRIPRLYVNPAARDRQARQRDVRHPPSRIVGRGDSVRV